MEIIFRGYHDKIGHLVSADVLQIGKRKPIKFVYDGERTLPVSEDFQESTHDWLVRFASCKVISPDGKGRRSIMLEKALEAIKK